MKAERRHELQTNDLAQALTQVLDRYRAYLPVLLWCVVAAMAALVAVSLWGSRQGSSASRGWEEFDQIRNVDAKSRPRRLKELAERYPGTDIALWARLDLADQLCFDGRSKMELDRDLATSHLREAQQNYHSVLQDPKARPEMIRRAALAEAKCWELLGDRDKAIESYKSVAKKYAGVLSSLAEEAASRASDLEKQDAAEFYKWFAEYKPPASKPLSTPMPGLGFPMSDTKVDSGNKSEPNKTGPDAATKPSDESKGTGERGEAEGQPKPESKDAQPTQGDDAEKKTPPNAATEPTPEGK